MGSSQQAVEALIVVDMQQAFLCGDHAVPSAPQLLDAVGQLINRARTAGALVIQLQNDGPPRAPDEPDTPGWALCFAAQGRETEHVIRKRTDDGFHETDLSRILHAHRVRRLAICGVMSEMCVGATARSAMKLGWMVVLAHDAHGTYDIPAVEGLAEAVPHAVVSRVAEWALGDQVAIVAAGAEITFESPPTHSTHRTRTQPRSPRGPHGSEGVSGDARARP